MNRTHLIAAFAASLFCVASTAAMAQEASVQEAPAPVQNTIRPISCGQDWGTAFSTEDGRFATAAHVVQGGSCKLSATEPLRPMDINVRLDVARGPTGAFDGSLKISCEAIEAGQQYILVGYPAGTTEVRRIFVRATGQTHDIRLGRSNERMTGLASVRGLAVQGMSGGPVLNQAGEVVGIISSVSPSARLTLFQPMINTQYCPRTA